MPREKEDLGAGWSQQKGRAPERARDERDRNLCRGAPRRPRRSRPREDQKGHGGRGEARREGRDHLELRNARVQLLKAHQEDRKAVRGKHMVVEGRRARRVNMGRHDQAGTREGRTGRRDGKDRYREKAAHLFKRIRPAFASGWCPNRLHRRLGRALAADPHDGRVGEVGAETLLRAQAPAERLEHAQGDLLLRATAAADEVAVSLNVRAMPARHAIVEMRVSDVAEILERLEVAVDGRRVDLRMPRADLARDLLRGGVMARALERVEHETALHCHPLSLRADLVRNTHIPRLPQSQASCKSPLLRELAITCTSWTSVSSCCFLGWPRSASGMASTGTTSPRSPTSRAPRARATPRRTFRPARRCPLTGTRPTSCAGTSINMPQRGRARCTRSRSPASRTRSVTR